MDKYPISSKSLEKHYHINGEQLGQQYKEHLSDYSVWQQKEHAEEWLLFPENLGKYLSIDETSLSNGELYTILTNKAAKGQKGALIAMVQGTCADKVIEVLERVPEEQRSQVKEVTLDMANSMQKIVIHCFPNASRVIDRFHVQKLAYDAVQEMRIAHRWDAINEENDAIMEAKYLETKHVPFRFENGDTKKQLLARSRYLLFKSAEKWTSSQKQRAKILFAQYPDIKEAYSLTHSLRMIFSKKQSQSHCIYKASKMVRQG